MSVPTNILCRLAVWFRLLALCLLVAAGRAAALPAEAPFIVDAWSTADGLPQSSVIAIAQSHDGYLWLGTLNGLVRFDGSTFTPFNVNNVTNLPSDKIVFLYEDGTTNLWVGTDNGGLCRIQNGVVQSIDTGSARGKVVFGGEDEAGTVWFCTDAGRFFSARNGMVNASPAISPTKLYYQVFHLLVPGKNGDAWLLQNGRVTKVHGDKPVRDYGPCPWTNSPVFASYRLPDGGAVQIPFDANITAACVDNDGNLVVGTFGSGVYRFAADGTCQHITVSEGLSHNFVLSLCADREGGIWVGTDTGGIDRLRKQIFTSPPGLADGVALSVAEDAQGGLWTTFNLRGLAYCLSNTVQYAAIGHSSRPWSVLVDRSQTVWLGTAGEGLFRRVDDRGFRPVPGLMALGAQIFALLQTRDGKVWVGGQNGLGCYAAGNWTVLNQRNGLPPEGVRALAEDDQGTLWVAGGGGGLFTLAGDQLVPATAPVQDVSCLLAGRNGVLWAGSSGRGLAWFKSGRWQRCSSFNGLATDDVGYLAEDDATNLWIGSYEGLMRVDEHSLFEATADPAKKVSCRMFLTRECSTGAQPAAIRTHDGHLWFPTTQGLVSLDPAELQLNPRPPAVVIEAVSVDGVPQRQNPLCSDWSGAVTLAPTAEQLEIRFTSLNFSAPKNARSGARFKWQLEPRDKNSTEVGGGDRVVHFNRLFPGRYRFHVTACNEDGVWNRTGAVLDIIVQPPFWQTRSFLISASLAVLGLLAGTIYLVSTAKLKRQVRTLHQKELIEKERARIARDLHDQIGANLTQVALLGEMAELDRELPGEVEEHARQICATARETTRSLDEIVWAVNPSNDTLEGLANYAGKYAQDYFALAGIRYRAELPTQLPPVAILPEVRHNVFLAFKEAVNNVVKHSRATEARVKLELGPEQFILSVADNGCGVGEVSPQTLRNGLKNMRRRLLDVGGEFVLSPGPAPEGGTVVQLKVPIVRLPPGVPGRG